MSGIVTLTLLPWLLIGALGTSGPGRAATVFENLQTPLGASLAALDSNKKPAEFGDELALAGTARIVTEFLFEYYGAFTVQGDETARIRFYANDAPGRALAPGTLLYDTGSFAISPGLSRATIPVPDVAVPNTFTWTVEFGGLSQGPNDRAELTIYNPPTIGAPLVTGQIGSYNDFWKRDLNGWGLFSSTNHVNFGARVSAVDESVRLHILPDPINADHVVVTWEGKFQSLYQLETTTDWIHWSTVWQVRSTNNAPLRYPVAARTAEGPRFYRALLRREAPVPAQLTVEPGPGTRDRTLRWQGEPNLQYQVRYSPNLGAKNVYWNHLATVTADANGSATYVHRLPTGANAGFYRVWTPW